jgi:hypothetical protein
MNAPTLSDTPSDEPKAQLTSAETTVRFMLAGDAHVTFVSARTGARFTYRVASPKDGPFSSAGIRFVSVLTGPDAYTYLGTIFIQRNVFVWTKKSPVSADAPSVRVFGWVWRHLAAGNMPPELEVWHEGRCGACGRRLTDPASISRGLGPTCVGRA